MNPDLDQGKFVLVHGDLRPSNLIVNENMTIDAVLDGEFEGVNGVLEAQA